MLNTNKPKCLNDLASLITKQRNENIKLVRKSKYWTCFVRLSCPSSCALPSKAQHPELDWMVLGCDGSRSQCIQHI